MRLHAGDSFLGLTDLSTGKRAASCDRMDEVRAANLGRLRDSPEPAGSAEPPAGDPMPRWDEPMRLPGRVYRDGHRLKRVWSMKGMVRRVLDRLRLATHLHPCEAQADGSLARPAT